MSPPRVKTAVGRAFANNNPPRRIMIPLRRHAAVNSDGHFYIGRTAIN